MVNLEYVNSDRSPKNQREAVEVKDAFLAMNASDALLDGHDKRRKATETEKKGSSTPK